jgi:hypothetical protein
MDRDQCSSQSTSARQHEPVGELLSLLADERRRTALYYLDEAESMTLTELSRHVAAAESGTSDPGAVSADECRTVYLDLYHTHVPKLTDLSGVCHDEDTGRIDCVLSRSELLDAVVGGVEAEWNDLREYGDE